MNASERLIENYDYRFSDVVLEAVEKVDAVQRSHGTVSTYMQSFGIDVNSRNDHIDIRPAEHDRDEAIVVHLPMANTLNAHNLVAIGGIANLFPDSRIIAFSNQGGGNMTSGRLNAQQRKRVSNGDFKPLTERVLKKIDAERIQQVDHIGASFGSELAIESAAQGVCATKSIVAIEPIRYEKRSLVGLATDFVRSGDRLEDYWEVNDLTVLDDALSKSNNPVSYILGLGSLTNLGIARGLTQERFIDRSLAALSGSETELTVGWGTSSELVRDKTLKAALYFLASELAARDGSEHPKRIKRVRILDQTHALTNDLALFYAITATGIYKNETAVSGI